jgi:hypothetical protein
VQCSILVLFLESSATIQWPRIVLGYTGRLVVIQQYSVAMSTDPVQQYNCTTLCEWTVVIMTYLDNSWRLCQTYDNQRQSDPIPSRIGLLSSLLSICPINFINPMKLTTFPPTKTDNFAQRAHLPVMTHHLQSLELECPWRRWQWNNSWQSLFWQWQLWRDHLLCWSIPVWPPVLLRLVCFFSIAIISYDW